MTHLNKIKILAKKYPNDTEFANEVRKYISLNQVCCDNVDNLEEFEELDSGSYGYNVHGKRCRICGELFIDKIE